MWEFLGSMPPHIFAVIVAIAVFLAVASIMEMFFEAQKHRDSCLQFVVSSLFSGMAYILTFFLF